MKNPRQWGIFLALLLIAFAGFGSIFYTMYRLRNHKEFLNEYNPNIERIEKAKGQTITLTETQGGNRKWVLKMKEIYYSKDNSQARLVGVQGLVYGDKDPKNPKENKVLFTFEAPSGEYYKETKHIILDKGAQMISPSAQVVLKAPHVNWYSGGMIYATGGVEMSKKDFGTTKAEKAIVTFDFSKIQFIGGASATIGNHPNAGD